MVRKKTHDEYIIELAVHSRVVALEEYQGLHTPILHRCLIHGEKHPGYPSRLRKGAGLQCCKIAAHRKEAARKNEIARQEHDEKIKGRLERVDPYIDSTVKIRYRCLKHSEVHYALPSNVLKGQGLLCCKTAGVQAQANRKKAAAAASYVDDLPDWLIPLEPYQGAFTPILHRCLIHGEEHKASPTQTKSGHGLKCCMATGSDNIGTCLAGTDRFSEGKPTLFYVVPLERFPGYAKCGIVQVDVQDSRFNDPQYSSMEVTSWECNDRIEAFMLEQALLNQTRTSAECPQELRKQRWAGYTEVRKMPAEDMINLAQNLVDRLHEIGCPYQFALEYVSMSSGHRTKCQELADLLA